MSGAGVSSSQAHPKYLLGKLATVKEIMYPNKGKK